MKLQILVVLAILCTAFAHVSKREKRFATLLQPGGSLGCVVTGNKLYINGLFEKELSDDEMNEFDDYSKSLNDYKKQLKTFMEQRQRESSQIMSAMSGRFPRAQKFDRNLDVAQSQPQAVQVQSNMPKAPPKPSFCNENITTQYVFDGCKVQNSKVYIGGQYARDLSEDEKVELQKFDVKFKAYEKTLRSTMQQQIGQLFGQQFSQLFGGGQSQSQIPQMQEPKQTPEIEAPETPKICALIV